MGTNGSDALAEDVEANDVRTDGRLSIFTLLLVRAGGYAYPGFQKS
jgi:hypothetical protein